MFSPWTKNLILLCFSFWLKYLNQNFRFVICYGTLFAYLSLFSFKWFLYPVPQVFPERQGKWKATTQSREFLKLIKRYYCNAYTDGGKQDAINLYIILPAFYNFLLFLNYCPGQKYFDKQKEKKHKDCREGRKDKVQRINQLQNISWKTGFAALVKLCTLGTENFKMTWNDGDTKDHNTTNELFFCKTSLDLLCYLKNNSSIPFKLYNTKHS